MKNGQNLLDLQIKWETLVRDRISAKSGTPLRSELDVCYHRLLPVMVQISEAISEEEISRLVRVAGNIINQNGMKSLSDKPVQVS